VIKAGIIGAIAGFIYVMSLTLLSPFCTLCFTPLLGVGVGYLAGWIDAPPSLNISIVRSGTAGGITGMAVMAGQILATVINAVLVTNSKQLPELMREIGLVQFATIDNAQYWQTTVIGNSICGSLNLLIITGLGAAGGLLWFQRHRPDAGRLDKPVI
jgi:hypothetical protein